MLAGLYDLNSEFYRLQSADLFIKSSFGIGPEFSQSGAKGASTFPDTAPGMRIEFKPVEGFIARAAVLGEYDTKVALGGWYYTATFGDLSETQPNGQPLRHRGSSGCYGLIDRVIYKSPDRPEQRLTGFLQAGVGDGRVNRFGSYLGAGLAVTAPFSGRSADELGLGPNTTPAISNAVAAQLRFEVMF